MKQIKIYIIGIALFVISFLAKGQSDCPVVTISSGSYVALCSRTFTISANVGVGISYEWYNNEIPIAGASSSSYTINASGRYYVKETSQSGCSSRSNDVFVEIGSPNAFITSSISCGNQVRLFANPYYGSHTFQWLKDGKIIKGATNPYYDTKSQGYYAVKITLLGTDGSCTGVSPNFFFDHCPNTKGGGGNSGGGGASIYAITKMNDNEHSGENLADAKSIELNIFPNPVTSTAKILFNLKSAGEVSIEVFDLAGKIVSSVTQSTYSEGTHELIWNSSRLQPGIYIMRLNSGEDIVNKKIVVGN